MSALHRGESGDRSPNIARALVSAVHDYGRVAGLTHALYRYPARLSPQLVRTCIELFTQPGDLVLDPFCGGGTTLVEATALGRDVVGSDINELAIFVSRAKTTSLTKNTLRRCDRLFQDAIAAGLLADSHTSAIPRHLRASNTWRIGRFLEAATHELNHHRRSPGVDFIRSSTLKTSQWAFDGRREIPRLNEFIERVHHDYEKSKASLLGYGDKLAALATGKPSVRLHRAAASKLSSAHANGRSVKLILTSPPYPGIHVLYHRWQVQGRRETEAPYWLAGVADGAASSFYTMGPRKQKNWDEYFLQAAANWRAIVSLCDAETTVLQIVGFSDIAAQLPRYLGLMTELGLTELRLNDLGADQRFWRSIPNRKWHADQKGDTDGSREVLLVHKLSC